MGNVTDMPSPVDGLTIKQRLFARYVARGESRKSAAELAGYKAGGNASDVGSKLMRNPKVSAEVERVMQELEREERVSLAHHVGRMQDLSARAEDAGQFSAAIQAEHYAGKASRLYVEQSHVVTQAVEAPETVLERLNSLIDAEDNQKG
jgi:phage terminase small subunit